ncbi:MAG: 4-(cytidine 5'-diphospho)-2-C-methyl-D-erythritol kinase [Armatimonadetes bacterium]|jgi:4-diphosphocytidyl-2C-methyl-D-erythritol kinase|nr:4-(cytidine 5'-diphospho)-2-C-methyl-D-erythritol kinase [Armatimonadota bacterium]
MKKITLSSYAKINLSLDVSNLRSDGYHDICSVAQVIDIADALEIYAAADGVIDVVVEDGDAPSGSDNIIYHACDAFFKTTGIEPGVRIVLRKRIPMQAGLGGGSGNAAAAVAGLNRLYGNVLSADDMAAIAAKVGSDTALFIYGGTVCISGRGEHVERLNDAPTFHLAVLKPRVGVSTKWAYSELDRRNAIGYGDGTNRVKSAIEDASYPQLIAALSNDFDPVITELIPEIARAKGHLNQAGAETTLLCGSGSAVFGVFDFEYKAQTAINGLGSDIEMAFACRTLTRAESTLV